MGDDDGGSDNHSRPQKKSFKKDELKAKKKAFLARKECIKKKTMELSVLCEVKACAVILGPDGKIETWPENRSDVQDVIDLFKKDCLNNKKRKHNNNDHGCKKKQVLGGDEGAVENFLKKVENKLDQVKKRIKEIKTKDQETGSASEFGNPLSGGIPPNAWPPKSSQNLSSYFNAGMLGFGNQLPGNIMSSTPGYFGGFPSNVEGMHLGPVVSSEPMSQLGFQSEQYLPCSLQLQSSNAASFYMTQSLHMPYSTGHTPYSMGFQQNCIDNSDNSFWTESLIFQETSSSNPTMETPCCFDYKVDEIHGFEQARQIPLSFDQCDPGFELAADEMSSLNQTMETPCLFDYQVDEIHGFEKARHIPLSFDQYGTEFELSTTENDRSNTRVEWTENQICTTQPSPQSSCFSVTSMTLPEEDELDVLLELQQNAPTLDCFNPDFGLMGTLGFS
ncbi:uncharacterized protein LOC111406806 [Olea europaea var. sylvestris]|uniref:uncharacterized protein LOC111406806 n=1 Tax=Olea europaea var. sylvestris TaxID=158386 RepID=UPI000C1D73BC|nr:uncharacterized protein LOC111406806 [Olea europaea var. sylvestris]